MKNPEPSICINVAATNPGQFFACCGLFELASRLWPGAEGWFDNHGFCISCDGNLLTLLDKLATTEISSSLTDEELKRLGTLLSAEKASLSPIELEEKERLREMWQRERLHLSDPFSLLIDWWSDEMTGATRLKTWAAKQLVIEIARPLWQSLSNINWSETLANCLQSTAEVNGLPFYFDSDNNSQNTPRDTGFGAFTLRQVIKSGSSIRPLLELSAFFGIQRFRPIQAGKDNLFRFCAWSSPLPISVAAAAAACVFCTPGEKIYEFRMLYRSKYMKAFLPAQIYQGD